jgi:hypothetical protein
MLFIAGSEDRRVPPAAVPEAYGSFQREGHPVQFLMIDGLGHHWALEHDINAKIWRFLSPHRLLDEGLKCKVLFDEKEGRLRFESHISFD